MAEKLKLAVLISGSGSNLQAVIDRVEAGLLDADIGLVVSSDPEAYGLVRAWEHGIPTGVVDYRSYVKKGQPKVEEEVLPAHFADVVSRQRIYSGDSPRAVTERLGRLVLAEKELVSLLDPVQPDLICLAGFMRLLSPYFIDHYQSDGSYRIMNIHPALLPAFPGTQGYLDTFNYGCKFGGITVHFVDEGEDTGPVIGQAVYPIWPEDTLETVQQRGLELEYILYPQCIQWVAQGDLQVVKGTGGRTGVQILDPNYPEFLQQLVQKAFTR